jgi:hypothetical protein
VCARRASAATAAAAVDILVAASVKPATSTPTKPAADEPAKPPASKPKKPSKHASGSGEAPPGVQARGSSNLDDIAVAVPRAGDRDYYGHFGCSMKTGVYASMRNRGGRAAQQQMRAKLGLKEAPSTLTPAEIERGLLVEDILHLGFGAKGMGW